MTKPLNDAELVAQFGRLIFGQSWAAGVSRLAGINERTAQRIAAAARDGQDYPGARGALSALHRSVARIAEQLAPYGDRVPPADTTFEMRLAGATVLDELVARGVKVKGRRSLADVADAVWRAMQLTSQTRGRAEA